MISLPFSTVPYLISSKLKTTLREFKNLVDLCDVVKFIEYYKNMNRVIEFNVVIICLTYNVLHL